VLEGIFRTIVYMSFSGGVLALVVLCLKALFQNRIPAFVWVILWLLVAARFLLPIRIESSLSLFNLDLLQRMENFIIYGSEDVNGDNRYGMIDDTIDGKSHALDDRLLQMSPVDNPGDGYADQFLIAKRSSSTSNTSMVDIPLAGSSGVRMGRILPLVWLLGFGMCFAFLISAYLRAWKRISSLKGPLNDDVLLTVDECSKLIGLRKPVAVYLADLPGVPCTLGILRPRLVLPLSLAYSFDGSVGTNKGQMPDIMRYVILHELCHIKRCDNIANVVYLFAACLHWFNPMAWYALFKFRADVEAACDEAVLKRIPDSKFEYGKAILAVAAMSARRLFLAVHTGASGDKKAIERRIRLIAQYGKKPLLWIMVSALVVVLTGAIGLTSSFKNKIDAEGDLYSGNMQEIVSSTKEEKMPGEPKSSYSASELLDAGVTEDKEVLKKRVEALLEKIIQEDPSTSSDAYDYIKKSKAFEELVSLGQPALQYMFEIFLESNEDGLKEYIMACACAKIMGVYDEERGIGVSSGREWFYKYGKFEAQREFQIVDADFDLYHGTTKQGSGNVILPEGTDKRNLEEVISNYILARNRGMYRAGEKAIEAHKIYRQDEKDGILTVYMQVKFNWFGFENGAFTIQSGMGGEGIPVRMLLKKSDGGEYEVVEYREAMDGGLWERSVREMFPADLAQRVIDGRWNKQMQQELWNIQVEKAVEYLKQINREDAPVVPYVDKKRQDPIYLVTRMWRDFPDWNGTREVLVRIGGKYPGINVRCILETKCTQINHEEYEVVLTKTWQIKVNGQQPVSYWKYRVRNERVQLEESQDNDGLVLLVK